MSKNKSNPQPFKLYFLSITTWTGLCPGAMHYYGLIYGDWKPDKCAERDSWQVEADVENPRGFRCQFNSRKEVIRQAKKTFVAHKLFGVLRVGDSGTYQPQRVLICPKSVRDKAIRENQLWKEQDALYRKYGDNPWKAGQAKRMEEINKEWAELWGIKFK